VVRAEVVVLAHVSANCQLADMMTKPLGAAPFHSIRSLLVA
jgi:hypothetical protein